ncbi:MAG: lysophospholipid acyltransferase family protein [Bacteroidales bacterium]|nr:lysophospholipid acyltransferase family protein [Bacteroidales bacterium]
MNARKKTVLDKQELQEAIGVRGLAGRMITSIAYKLFELEEVNRIHTKYVDSTGPDFSAHVLEEVGVSYEIPEEQLARIPAEGGFITVSNHHFGSLDGMILSSVVGKARPDYKILTTFLLALIPCLKDTFIGVNNFSSGGAQSISGIRTALGHIADGHPLGLFPAGEVGTWQRGKNRTALGKKKVVEDIPWAHNVIKLVKKSGFPVIPIYFEGENSRRFHILGMIHPRLRTARLVKEMLNKRGTVIKVRIGAPIPASEIAEFDVPSLGSYLRSRCYALEEQCKGETREEVVHNYGIPVADPVPPELIHNEIEGLGDHILYETGDYRAYLLKKEDAPYLMKELFRLREESFRRVGEGTGKPEDTDKYDDYYHQMIVWNIPNGDIVGAYRLGFGPEIMAAHGGIEGFYSDSLIKYGPKAKEYLPISMELGRSFVSERYQREVIPLKLLLTGLAVAAYRNPEIQYYTGPVSISSDMPGFYQSLAVHYLMRDYKMPDAEEIAKPSHPFRAEFLRVDPDQLLQFPKDGIDYFDRLISAISDGKYRLPVLVRKYFSCNAKAVCFNVDPDFENSLDCTIFLKHSDFPENTLRSIVRGLPEDLQDGIYMHFYGRHKEEPKAS